METKDIERKAEAHWSGSIKDGGGKISLGSGMLKDAPYNVGSRFATEKGTNPEELLGAAHAACYAMNLSSLLTGKGYVIQHLDVEDRVFISSTSPRSITHIKLVVHAKVDHLEPDVFQAQAEESKRSCPISKALTSVPIELEAFLD